MLAHSPPLPLAIDFFHTHRDITTEDEKEIFLALERRDRVRRVRLLIPPRDMMWNLIWAIGEEYPVLGCLIMTLNVPVGYQMARELPRLQAPRLRHLILRGFMLPIKSRLLATAVGLVTLCLDMYRHNNFQPDTLLQILLSISLMPQLETLLFVLPHRNMGLRFRVLDALFMTQQVTLPNLRRLVLEGFSECTEAVVRHIAAPLLETLDIRFFDQLMLTVRLPCLFQFVNTTENIRFDCAKFKFFGEGSRVDFYPRTEAKTHSLSIYVHNDHLRWQVSALAEIFNSTIFPSQIFSTVEHLTLEQRVHRSTSERHKEVDRTKWRNLLRPFSNAKTLHVDDGLANVLFRIFPPEYESPDNGKLALELLPGLEELTYCGWLRSNDTAFTSSIIDTRQNAGHLVTLFRPSPRDMSLLSRWSRSRSDVMSLAGSIGGTYGELLRSWLEATSESIPEPDSRIRTTEPRTITHTSPSASFHGQIR